MKSMLNRKNAFSEWVLWAIESPLFGSRFAAKRFAFLAPAFGEKGGKFMKRHATVDPNQPIGNLHVIPDFLPPPEELFPKREAIKVTLAVDKESVDFFRKKAHNAGLKYQRMMRDVLREYSHRYQ
jgi:predicted DNA binding CopG/RHH family protein